MSLKTLVASVISLLALNGCLLAGERAFGSVSIKGPFLNAGDYSGYPFSRLELVVGKGEGFNLQLKRFSLEDSASLASLKDHALWLAGDNAPKSLKISKGIRKGLKHTAGLIDQIQSPATSDRMRLEAKALVLEMVYSFNSNYLSPMPQSGDILNLPTWAYRYIGLGSSRATNLLSLEGDLSLIDPQPSSFWQRPAKIAQRDVVVGFGRKAVPNTAKEICEYKEAKGGYGTLGGFTVLCGKSEYKVKWGNETNSEPFNTRIVYALGYNTNIIDYMPSLRMKYDRKIFSEYNKKDIMSIEVSAFFIPLTSIDIAVYRDPFEYIDSVHLKDGRVVRGADFKSFLLTSQAQKAEEDERNYRVSAEQQITFIKYKPGNIQSENEDSFRMGRWGWGKMGFYGRNNMLTGSSLGHENRRELRGFGLLAAWLNTYDVRWDNNRLRLFKDRDGSIVMKHVISDLGSGLGSAVDPMAVSNHEFKNFPWKFTVGWRSCSAASSTLIRDHCIQHGYAIDGYQTADRNDAFREMTWDDARWMGRMIAQLSREQIRSALQTAGFSREEVHLYTLKLLARRDRMVLDLELKEFGPLLAPGEVRYQ